MAVFIIHKCLETLFLDFVHPDLACYHRPWLEPPFVVLYQRIDKIPVQSADLPEAIASITSWKSPS